MVVRRHPDYFSHFESYIQVNIDQYERPCNKQTGEMLTCFNEI